MERQTIDNSIRGLAGALNADTAFRRHFLEAPASALRERGYDPDAIELPDSSTMDLVEARIKEASRIDPDGDIWEGLKDLLADPDTDGPTSPTVVVGPAVVGPAIVMTMVIYGTSVAVAVVMGDNTDKPDTTNAAAQLKALRAIARLDPAELRFSVHGPDGEVAEGLSRDVLDVFLTRLN